MVDVTFIILAFSPGRSSCRENLVRGLRVAGWRGRCRSGMRRAVRAVVACVGGRGWEHGGRAACDAERTWDCEPGRLAWRGDPAWGLPAGAVEHAGQYSRPV